VFEPPLERRLSRRIEFLQVLQSRRATVQLERYQPARLSGF